MNKHHKTYEAIQEELQQIEAAKLDPSRFDLLYDRYYRSVFVFIYRRTGDQTLSADICSQVFLKALVNIKRYVYKGVPFSAWLFRIAFNEINQYFRKSSRDRLVSIETIGLQDMLRETDRQENDMNLQVMLAELKKMKMEDIQLIELRFFEKRSFAEVGEILGITENNAKVKLYRVLDKLKEQLNGKLQRD